MTEYDYVLIYTSCAGMLLSAPMFWMVYSDRQLPLGYAVIILIYFCLLLSGFILALLGTILYVVHLIMGGDPSILAIVTGVLLWLEIAAIFLLASVKGNKEDANEDV